MKYADTSWFDELCITEPEEDKRFTKMFKEIFGEPLTKEEEDEWDWIERRNRLIIAARKT